MSTAVRAEPTAATGAVEAAAAPRARAPRARSRKPRSDGPSRRLIYVGRTLLLLAFLGLWEIASRSKWIDPLLFGSPSGAARAFFHYVPSAAALTSLRATLTAVAIAFVIGSVTGTVAGLALGLSKTLDGIVGPFLAPLNSIPRIALAPLFIAWFGLTINAKVVLAVSIVFFILTENARSAVRSVDFDLMTMGRVMGLSKTALVWKVVLPSAVPTMFAGLRLAFTYSLLGVIASEMIAATSGLGQDIVRYSSDYQINTVFAIIAGLVIIAVVVNTIFTLVERRLLIWQKV
jgi:NitT/TauT family transport system permease protein